MSEESESRDNRVSVIGPIIEVATINERHRQPGLLKEFGTKIILRLGVDPVQLTPGTLKRAITVDRISPASGETRWEEIREIGWADLPDDLEDCAWVRGRVGDNTITEHAAIGVMLLLIHELEGGISAGVLQIGSGGDYLIRLEGRPDPIQVEVSGIKNGSSAQASSRLGEKRGQIRGPGFASVTTFQHDDDGAAHSYLHFVVPGGGARKTGRKRRKGRKGKRS